MQYTHNITEKTFLLGVGAQKAGTSWLHHYLNSNALANFGRMKEYHIWDGIYGPFKDRFAVNATSEMINKQINSDYTVMDPTIFRHILQNDINRYFDYFVQLLDRDDCNLTGDITPSYAMLSSEAFKLIRDNFHNRDIIVKSVFIMRDPVERCWSAVQMHKMRGKSRLSGTNASDEEQLLYYYSTKEAVLRTRYAETVKNLRAAINEEQIYIGNYETMFERPELERLCHFCNIPFEEAPVDIKINKSIEKPVLSKETTREVAEYYRDVYKFCFENFQIIWPNSKLVL